MESIHINIQINEEGYDDIGVNFFLKNIKPGQF